MNYPLDPALYVTSFEEISWGIGLVALTMGVHGLGMLWTLRLDSSFKARFGHRPSFIAGLSNIVVASSAPRCRPPRRGYDVGRILPME